MYILQIASSISAGFMWGGSLAIAPALTAFVLYGVFAAVLGGGFLYVNRRLLWEPDANSVWAKRTFFASLVYLPALFTAMAVCVKV